MPKNESTPSPTWEATGRAINAATLHLPGLVSVVSHFDLARGRLVFEFKLTPEAQFECYRMVLPRADVSEIRRAIMGEEVATADGGNR